MESTLDPAAESLLRSRLCAPEGAIDLFPRPRIEATLLAHPQARVLLFSAPAGFGKTCALGVLAQQRAQAGYAVAWLSLDAGDDEPSRFFLHLIEVLARQVPGLGSQARDYLQNAMGVPVAALMEIVLADLAQVHRPLLLVLDDLHLIQHAELLAALKRLIRYAPEGFVLALASRSQPALGLATLRAKGLLVEFGERDLRLSQAETRDYLARHGLQLEAAAFAALYRHTEGWMVGVHLASLWLRHQPQAWQQLAGLGPGQASVGDYLLHRVFEQLPEAQQGLLETLGVAQQLCGDLANALTGRQDGQQQLETLEAMQLFLLPLDRERRWYRFHNLFAEFLRGRLRGRAPERCRQLHFRASLWFANHRMQILAIEHASLAEDPRMLAALVDGCGLELINRGQLHLIHRWRQRVPDEIAAEFPMLVLADVWTRAAELGLAEANRMLDAQLRRWDPAGGPAALNDRLLATLTIKALIALQKDDLPGCAALAHRVELQLGQHAAFLEVAMLIVGALANVMLGLAEVARRQLALAQQRHQFLQGHYLAMQMAHVEVLLCLEQGQVKRAERLFAQLRARTMPCFAPDSRALALPTISQALIDYRQGRLEGVEERLRWALATVDVINPLDLYAQGMLCLAQTQRALAKPKEAFATLRQMQDLAMGSQAWRFYAQAASEEVAQLLQEPAGDRLKRAEQRYQSIDWSGLAEHYRHMGCNPVLWGQGLTRIRLLQARAHYSEALHEISQLRRLLRDDWHGTQRLRLDLLTALSHQHLGYQGRAQCLLDQCLLGAEHEGLRSLFIEEGAPAQALLLQHEAAERQPALQGFIRSILALWVGQVGHQSPPPLAEGLTEREDEIVQLAAEGLSNVAIGERLALALGTVKWHLHNIYEKLGVRNRTQAVRRAQELGLVGS
ncbi:LuxR C-terminal-related transcriptional regulator [Pseudomonas benzenivorans]|uniref:Helix-turn-helix transcriptional regulator n=1 Tax=Pseudomonas benzenivorans TaxID=556533 RepID=A0ABY5H5I6_9PSED|nr:LuxR C-terminal-related transcriptional regulator [Pseudomonas benzenivorans]UTW07576.1 helix-turn-helix transcriptional regulator [Pseudomonas benzenivorans]